MTDIHILGAILAIVWFAAGFCLGRQRGYVAGIRWATNRLDEQLDTCQRPEGSK